MEKKLKDIIMQWVLKAENDFKTAKQLFQSDEIITDTLCFHCQQMAEKYLKAFLVWHNIVPEKTHKIERLIEACSRIDLSFVELKNATLLTEYAVEFRYPDDFFIPSLNEAKIAYNLAVKIKKFVLERIKIT